MKMFLGIVSILKGNMSKGIKMIEELKQVSIESGRERLDRHNLKACSVSVYLQIAQGGEETKPAIFNQKHRIFDKKCPSRRSES